MDATKKPLLIPPEFSTYSEKHGIFTIYEETLLANPEMLGGFNIQEDGQLEPKIVEIDESKKNRSFRLLKKLLIHQPEDPLKALVGWLKEPEDVHQIFILGPPGAGKRTISREIAHSLGCIYICREDLKANTNEDIVEGVKKMTQSKDCIEKGWLLEGIPMNREQALGLQVNGVFPKHVVLLQAPDTVLCERVIGKRIDSLTGDVYHETFHPPTKDEVIKRLVTDPNSSQEIMRNILDGYRRDIDGTIRCYEHVLKKVNADQPKDDVMSQTLQHLAMRQRSNAPHTPRVLLVGPPGCGKSMQAMLLANKYNLVNVNCGELIKQKLEDESDLGESMKPFIERGIRIPDEMLVEAINERLRRLDATKRGWVLHGFPTTRAQVDEFAGTGIHPNRVFVLDASSETVVERISFRSVDPVTGQRYHMLYNPPSSAEVKARLKTHPDDREEVVMKQYTNYQGEIEDIMQYYSDHQVINGEQDIQSVFECIETLILNPLPKNIP